MVKELEEGDIGRVFSIGLYFDYVGVGESVVIYVVVGRVGVDEEEGCNVGCVVGCVSLSGSLGVFYGDGLGNVVEKQRDGVSEIYDVMMNFGDEERNGGVVDKRLVGN